MHRQLAVILLLVFAHGIAFGQLVVDQTYTPQQLVENVLIGQGVQVSNVTFTGASASRGYFNGSNSNIGLSAGVILSSGRVTDAVGPNTSSAGSTAEEGTDFGTQGDPALTAISGSMAGTFNASVLEFDFIPSSDTVQFRFVFASNEYMVWIGTANINDLFAFFLSGPGISGDQNIALIPGTTTPITMLNVNANVNSQYYIDNGDDPGEQGGSSVDYNGFTTVLTAMAVITPCEEYHIRLAIADGGDGFYDSAVFLEEGSFTSPSVSISAESSFSASASAQQLVEGCSEMTLTFERSAPFDDPLSIGLTFSGSATVGDDITSIPNAVTFPAGAETATISFSVIDDGIVEGLEDMTITLNQLNPCSTGSSTSVTFTIEDAEPMTLQITPDVTLTCPEERLVEVIASGGYGNYSYSWNSGQTASSITVTPVSSNVYTVTVTDACGFAETASSTVSIPNYQPLSVSVTDVVVCGGEEVTLESTVQGGFGNISYLWDGGGGMQPTYTFNATQTVDVNLVVTDDCGLSETGSGTVTVDTVEASFTHQLVAHSTVQFTSSTSNVFDFSWDFGDGTGSTRESPLHEYEEEGDYPVSLTVVNSNGCETTLYDTVTVYPPLHVYIPNSFTPNGDGINDVFGVEGEGYLYYDLEIFDRWGNMLKAGRFRDNTAWDGTYRKKFVPTGMYVYRVWVQPPIGIEVKESGALYVISGEE